jgi:hypothetical protein
MMNWMVMESNILYLSQEYFTICFLGDAIEKDTTCENYIIIYTYAVHTLYCSYSSLMKQEISCSSITPCSASVLSFLRVNPSSSSKFITK